MWYSKIAVDFSLHVYKTNFGAKAIDFFQFLLSQNFSPFVAWKNSCRLTFQFWRETRQAKLCVKIFKRFSHFFHPSLRFYLGQRLCHSQQSGHFRLQRTRVRFQASAFYKRTFEYCRKDKTGLQLYTNTLTKWLEYLFNIWPFATIKILPIASNVCQIRLRNSKY